MKEGSSACKVSVSTGVTQEMLVLTMRQHNCFQINHSFGLHMLGSNYEDNCILAQPVVYLVCIALGSKLMCRIDNRNWVSQCASDQILFSNLKMQWQARAKKTIEWRATRIKPWTPRKCEDGERRREYSSVNRRGRSRFAIIVSSYNNTNTLNYICVYEGLIVHYGIKLYIEGLWLDLFI